MIIERTIYDSGHFAMVLKTYQGDDASPAHSVSPPMAQETVLRLTERRERELAALLRATRRLDATQRALLRARRKLERVSALPGGP